MAVVSVIPMFSGGGGQVTPTSIEVPSTQSTLVYNGDSQSPVWDNYDPDQIEISGDVSGINAGTYVTTFTLKDGYTWEDGTTESKSVEWIIDRAVVSDVPYPAGVVEWTGDYESPVWIDYDTSKLNISGEISAKYAGTYEVSFFPTSNYKWSDGRTGSVYVTWTLRDVFKEIVERTVEEIIDEDEDIYSIDIYRLCNCSSLQTVSFPACSDIANHAFSGCTSLQTVSFPACTNIENYAFSGCTSLQSVSFPVCTSIGSYVFSGCVSLQSVSFPVCTSIGSAAFYYCSSLQSVSFPVCTIIGSSAFRACTSLQSVSFPVCSYIEGSVFSACTSLQSVSFPVCTSIGSNAFYNCSSLQSASFPMCEKIGNSAFRSCTSLMNVYLMGSTLVSLGGSYVFTSTPMSLSTYTGSFGSIHVPSSLYSSYIVASYWSAYSARITST